jgi:Fe-S-cluster containining protein
VWVNKQEIEALAEAMGMEVEEFERRNVRKIGIRRSLRELRNYDCVLLDPATRKCRAYQARPRQCRTWPFWDSNLSTPEAWQRTCEVCPGSGRGQLHQLTDIEAQRQTIRV